MYRRSKIEHKVFIRCNTIIIFGYIIPKFKIYFLGNFIFMVMFIVFNDGVGGPFVNILTVDSRFSFRPGSIYVDQSMTK